ncbi:hypothetical protein ACIHFD_62375 [Nonomuraea sp. NPDC051941]|uniref:hypothetical protein n=1 Tax=Nonomuraea sp. NPDC051941 TaxID=3364373 RepID=UPI0037CBCAA6
MLFANAVGDDTMTSADWEEIVQQGASGCQWNVDGTRAVAADLRALADGRHRADPT